MPENAVLVFLRVLAQKPTFLAFWPESLGLEPISEARLSGGPKTAKIPENDCFFAFFWLKWPPARNLWGYAPSGRPVWLVLAGPEKDPKMAVFDLFLAIF